MPSVTSEIKRLLKEKDANVAAAADAIKGLLTEVRRQIVDELQDVPADSYTAFYLRQNLASVELYLAGFESSAGSDLSKMIDSSWQAGSELLPAAARAGGMAVAFGHIPGPLLQTLKDMAVYRIESLTDAAFDKIRGELTLGVLGQKTPHQVVQAIAGSLDGPGIFRSLEERAETIVKLEMGRAFSAATNKSLVDSAASVPGLKRQWWHAGHPRMPRLTHLGANGQVRAVGEPFQVGMRKIDYPRAPNLPIEEAIKCG